MHEATSGTRARPDGRRLSTDATLVGSSQRARLMAGIESTSLGELTYSGGEGPPESSASEPLFWSKRGDVACPIHAPDRQSDRWRLEGWRSIPVEANGRHGLAYQCPRCAPD